MVASILAAIIVVCLVIALDLDVWAVDAYRRFRDKS